MFTFFEAYDPNFWEGLRKSGMLRKCTGVRFNETVTLDERKKFNNMASLNSELFKMQKENPRPMYIDRLQGGVFYEGYPYDEKLLNAWRKLLGDKFWGFQLHEMVSNYRSDLRKLAPLEKWTADGIKKRLWELFPDIPKEYSYLESVTPEEMVSLGKPETAEEFMKNAEKIYLLRNGKELIPCDSFDIPFKMELRLGAERIMPEIGSQTPMTRLQISYARSLSKSYDKSFGVYYEPWGGVPFSGCNYHKEGLNEWQLTNDFFPYKTNQNGGNGLGNPLRGPLQ